MASLRAMRIEDLARIEPLEKTLFGLSAWPMDTYQQELSDNPYSHYAVMEIEGEIVGYCGYMALYENADILTIGVSKKHQQHGYGRMMMDWMLHEAKQAGAKSMSLEVRKSNLPAITLYHRCGFSEVAIRPRYYQDGEDALLMIKRLEAYK